MSFKNISTQIIAAFTAAIVMLTAAVPVFAEETTTPSANDVATASIYGIEYSESVTVTAYQIIEAVYGTNGLTRYIVSSGTGDEDTYTIKNECISFLWKYISFTPNLTYFK